MSISQAWTRVFLDTQGSSLLRKRRMACYSRENWNLGSRESNWCWSTGPTRESLVTVVRIASHSTSGMIWRWLRSWSLMTTCNLTPWHPCVCRTFMDERKLQWVLVPEKSSQQLNSSARHRESIDSVLMASEAFSNLYGWWMLMDASKFHRKSGNIQLGYFQCNYFHLVVLRFSLPSYPFEVNCSCRKNLFMLETHAFTETPP